MVDGLSGWDGSRSRSRRRRRSRRWRERDGGIGSGTINVGTGCDFARAIEELRIEELGADFATVESKQVGKAAVARKLSY